MKNTRFNLFLQTIVKAIGAGFAIGIGGCIYLACEIKIVGALMFTVGLYTICTQALNLFTGKVGYLPEKEPAYILDLIYIWIGNFLGTGLAAVLVNCTRERGIAASAVKLCEVKLNDGMLSLFILGIFCGFLMFIAVDGYAKTKNPLILFMGVATFILCGFEHCIADMFYFSLAGMWSLPSFFRVFIITLGNALGGMLIPLINKIKVESD